MQDKRDIISAINENKEQLLDELFHRLGINPPNSIGNADFKLIDKKLKEFGLEKAHDELLLNLIVFAGEYIRYKKGGAGLLNQMNRTHQN